MKKAITELNNLLKRQKNSISVIQLDGKVVAAVWAKDSGDSLKLAIEEAIKEDMDYEHIRITSFTSTDYGYQAEFTIEYTQDGDTNTENFSMALTFVY